MYKISMVEAFTGMNEVDFKVYDHELETIGDWAFQNDVRITKHFYITTDGETIYLIVTKDDTGEEVIKLAFKNNGDLMLK